MCEYCGCQQIAEIGRLTDEHDQLRNLGALLTAAADRDDRDAAAGLAGRMLAVLSPHTAVEERGLFPAMADEYAAPLDRLVDEHRELDAALSTIVDVTAVPDSWPDVARTAVRHLFEHILKEQDGVFPAALATLTGRDWDVVAAVRETVTEAINGRVTVRETAAEPVQP